MMLEKHVVLVSNTADTTEHVAAHKVVSVGAEAVDDLARMC